MLAFFLEPEQRDMFVALCDLSGATTKEEMETVLMEMAKAGLIKSVTQVTTDKPTYLKHLEKHFGNVRELFEGDSK